MSKKEPINIQKLVIEKMKKDGPAIYRHLGYEQDHLREMLRFRKEEGIEFFHELYLPKRNDAGEIIQYLLHDTQRYLGDLKNNHKKTHAYDDGLENMTFKNVFFFEGHENIFEEAVIHQLPFLIISYPIKDSE